ncbi:hypothetical protein [Nonomuraea sp. NPDC049750]|uniref:hypothetical protein n=1 Tax=Nonomuraea sp. NPDC049750 TaxID=3154738 RepID=UPI0033D92B87
MDKEAAARIQSAAAKNPGSDTAQEEFDRRAESADDRNAVRDDDGESTTPGSA